MRRRPAAIGEDEVLTSATHILLDRGLQVVSPDSVAALLGVPVALVHRLQPRFPQFVADVFRRAVAAELAEVKRAVLVHPAAPDQLRSLVALLAQPMHVEISAAWHAAFALGRHDSALAAAVRGEQTAWLRFVAGVVQRGVRSGDWSTDAPETVAAHLLAVVDGINAYALVDYDLGVARRAMLESVLVQALGVRLAPPEPVLHQSASAR